MILHNKNPYLNGVMESSVKETNGSNNEESRNEQIIKGVENIVDLSNDEEEKDNQSSKEERSSTPKAVFNDHTQEVEELKDILQDLFPNYQQHYWNDRSTWNPIKPTG